ncbi:hypothetical protein BJ912DRAFT_1022609 [Pholiota molesta]|nr:hypothetical protein BJ912DRAFT_1022609 [Pholiota molesta]
MLASPWPAPTAAPPLPPPPPPRPPHAARQVITDQDQVAQAMTNCQINSGNNVFSCFPTADTTIPQHQWASFVWNSRRPDLTQTNLVDIFLFRADTQEQVLNFTNQTNPSDQAGVKRTQVDDSWFGSQGLAFAGHNVSFPFYWVIIRSDKTLDGNQVPQPIFTAVQTTVLDSVASASAAASSSSVAAAAASSSSVIAASLSSVTAASLSSVAHSGTATPSGAVQRAASGSPFPRWAIAVIVVLGFLAIAATCILAFLILRRVRRARERTSSAASSRNSMGSASPMIQRDADAVTQQRYDAGGGSPLLPPPGVGGAVLGGAGASARTMHDGASTISDSGGPFSGADAAIMADAFRKMLRKPDFAAGRVDEGPGGAEGHGLEGEDEEDEEELDEEGDVRARAAESSSNVVLSRELAEEGRDIRSVSSSRGVRVETQPER